MINEIINFFRKYIIIWVIALISFISGLGIMCVYGHRSVAILISLFVLIVAIVGLVHAIDLTEGRKDDDNEKKT